MALQRGVKRGWHIDDEDQSECSYWVAFIKRSVTTPIKSNSRARKPAIHCRSHRYRSHHCQVVDPAADASLLDAICPQETWY